MRYLIALCLLIVLIASTVHAAGTINLPTGPYCATTQAGAVYNGVTAGACAVIPDPQPGAGCPQVAHTPFGDRTLVTRASIVFGATARGLRPNADVTTWDGLLGFGEGSVIATPWPGVGGNTPVVINFPANGYICARFRTPANVNTRNGRFSNPSYLRAQSPSLTMAISTAGGDFNAHLPTPGCVVRNVPASDSNLPQWKGTANNPTGSCNFQPNTDYYLNITLGDVPGCSRATCALGVVSYHN